MYIGAGVAVLMVAIASGSGLAGCTSTSCTTEARASLIVTVVNAAGRRVCDASVTATDGAFSAPLSPNGDPTSCTYDGPYERAGTYSIDVRSGPTAKRLDAVKVTADACHVRAREVSVVLDR